MSEKTTSAAQRAHNEVKTMAEQIKWEREWDRALDLAATENRPVLLFFHNPD